MAAWRSRAESRCPPTLAFSLQPLAFLFMSLIRPFAALRPKALLADKICELPYDVMSSAEAREIARGNPLSFLHVSKPEIDLPVDLDVHAPEVYAKGRQNFQNLIAQGALATDK